MLYCVVVSASVSESTSYNTRLHAHSSRARVLARQNFFSVRVVQVWNNLPNEVVSATCVSVFKSLLNSIHVSFFNVVF